MTVTDEHRDSHGNDVITFPELRLMDGRIIKETNFYYYYDIKQVNPDAHIMQISAKKEEGLDELAEFIRTQY